MADASGVIIPPQAILAAAAVDSAGGTSYNFQVVYSDNLAVSAHTIDDQDTHVTGPGGFNANARLVALSQVNDGTPITATYQIPAPGGLWDESDNGAYLIWLNSNQVADVEGAFVAGRILGTFTASVPSIIYGANMSTNPGWVLGSGWAFGKPNGNSGDPSSGATGTNVVGYNLNGAYARNVSLTYATTPAISSEQTDIVILRFRRWLGVRSGDTATIQVSSNGLNWTTIWSSSGDIADSNWQTVQYDISAQVARSPSMQVRWGMGSNNDGRTSFGWNIDDVEILGVSESPDIEPPQAVLSAQDITLAGGVAYDFTVTYSDESAVSIASLGDDNIIVTGPLAFVQSAVLAGIDDDTDGSPRTAIYQITAPGGEWREEYNGEYIIQLLDGVISDTQGNAMSGQELGRFAVSIVAQPPEQGSILVNLEPAEAISFGAQWELAGSETNWRNSGDSIGELDPGIYTVSFREIAGWSKPEDRFVEVTGGETSILTVHYTALVTDNYHVPIWWLEQYGITNDYETLVESLGANGIPLWQSYVAGLDPGNPSSMFMLDLSDAIPGEDFILRWNSVSGRVYSIYRMSQPGEEPWPIPDAQNISWPQNTYTNDVDNENTGILQIRVRLP